MVLFPLQAVSRKTISVTSTTRYRGKRYFPRVQWRCRFSFRVSRSNFKRNVEPWVCTRCNANGITAVLREAAFSAKCQFRVNRPTSVLSQGRATRNASLHAISYLGGTYGSAVPVLIGG